MFETFAVTAFLTFTQGQRADCNGDLSVLVRGFRSTVGQAALALFATADGFPIDAERAAQKATAKIADGTATVTFTRLVAGDYAVSAIHDDNMNGRIDRNWVGKPKEGYGVSNDAKARRFGPPTFDDARFHVSCGMNNIVITLTY
jgi:uncharacterized protein (DUF2141 family)